jgi:asparagine synthetase B (glutamine-hydrolysing)
MPGLFGIVDFEKKPDASLFNNLASKITPFKTGYLQAEAENCLLGFKSLGIVDSEGQPFYDRENSLTLFFWGEVFERNNQVPKIPEYIFELYLEDRLKELEDINGFFSLALWDGKNKTLILATDIHGTRPLYCYPEKSSLIFGPNPFALARTLGRGKVNKEAMLQFMAFSKIYSDHTWIDGIRKIRYGQILQFDRSGLQMTQYFWPDYNPVNMSIEEAAEGILEKLEKAAIRMSGGKAALSLSGGGDSRLLAALLKKNKILIPAFTYGAEESEDMTIAEEVTSHLEMPHHKLIISPDFLRHHLEAAVYNTGGYVSALNFHGISTRENVKKICDICISGLYGNNYLGYISWFLFKLSQAGSSGVRREIHHKLFDNGQVLDSLERLMSFEIDRRELIDGFFGILDNYSCQYMRDAWMLFDHFEVNSQSSLAGFWLENDMLEFRSPYCDRDLLEFNLQIPLQYKIMMHLGRHIWTNHYPGLGIIKHQRTGLPLNTTIKKLIVQEVARRILKKRRPPGIIEYSAVFEYELKEWLKEFLLSKDSLIRDYLNMDTVTIRIGTHTEFDSANAEQLGQLLTLEQVLRVIGTD